MLVGETETCEIKVVVIMYQRSHHNNFAFSVVFSSDTHSVLIRTTFQKCKKIHEFLSSGILELQKTSDFFMLIPPQ